MGERSEPLYKSVDSWNLRSGRGLFVCLSVGVWTHIVALPIAPAFSIHIPYGCSVSIVAPPLLSGTPQNGCMACWGCATAGEAVARMLLFTARQILWRAHRYSLWTLLREYRQSLWSRLTLSHRLSCGDGQIGRGRRFVARQCLWSRLSGGAGRERESNFAD